MKSLSLAWLFVFLIFLIFRSNAQTIYTYSLTSDFSSVQAGGPDLVQISNNSGATGNFTTRSVPASTCGQGGTAGGYFFEDDAGLQFNNPEGFIGQSYSLAFNFQVDEFITPPPWVRILSFTHVDDVGVYIYLTNPPTNGTLEFWPYGTVGQYDFFNTADFYQLILVRTANGLIKIYINGQEFAEYDDSQTQKFVPAPPDNYIVFFRDHPSVLANEASPGFVSGIIIRNLSWTADEVQEVWENFCSSLLHVDEPTAQKISIYPNPAYSGKIQVQLPGLKTDRNFRVYDHTGNMVLEGRLAAEKNTLDISRLSSGFYMLAVGEGRDLSRVRFIVL
jgi:hypothetical protein